jgi:hypothetical protein
MRYFHKNKQHFFCPTINVEKLWTLVSPETRTNAPKGKAPVIDCVRNVRAPPKTPHAARPPTRVSGRMRAGSRPHIG